MEVAAGQPLTYRGSERMLNHHLDPIKHNIQPIKTHGISQEAPDDAVKPIKIDIAELTKRVVPLETNCSFRPASVISASGRTWTRLPKRNLPTLRAKWLV
eukprot:8905581-Pyramimonas_sp.AAC.1